MLSIHRFTQIKRTLQKTTPASVCAALFAAIIMPASGWSATPSKWSSSPSWAASGAEAPSRRASDSSRDANISPFSPGSNNLALDVGQVFLMGDLADRYADSIGMQLHYTYGVSEMFGFDSSLGYSQHSDGEYSMATLLTGLRTNLAWYDKAVPYIVFGLGFYKPSIKVPGTESSIAPTLFGLHLGPGVDLELTKTMFFGAALTFHDMFGAEKRTQAGLMDVGGTYTSFFMHIGYSF